MASAIVGREDELGRLRRFLDAGGLRRPRGLVLEGEAGIGKSTLWLAGVAEARDRGLRVLVARPAEAERGLGFAALGDLLEGVVDDVLPRLSPPRRSALANALLVEESEAPTDPRALAVAVRSALELLAADGRLLVAIDDVQWIDGSSASTLAFALRRLDVPMRCLFARRATERAEPSELQRALRHEDLEQLAVGPLSLGAVQTLLHERLDRVFTRPTLVRIHETAGGNPFYAVELGRALGPEIDATRPLPVPDSLEALVSARLSALPQETRDGLALVAAAGSPTRDLLRRVGLPADVLEAAAAERVIEQASNPVRFAHPLLPQPERSSGTRSHRSAPARPRACAPRACPRT